MRKLALLDTNLLVLFIVGGTSIDYITRHKNCSQFNERDYEVLLLHLAVAAGLATTPQILSETSNLIRQVADPMKAELSAFFKLYVLKSREISVSAIDAVNDRNFSFLGLNDAAILNALRDDLVLITEDGNLHAAACRRSANVLHFSQLREH